MAIKTTFKQYLSEAKGISPSSLKHYSSDINHFERWMVLRLGQIGVIASSLDSAIPYLSPEATTSYKEYMINKGLAPRTINRKLSTLRHFSRFTKSTGQTNDFAKSLNNMKLLQNQHSQVLSDKTPSPVESFKEYLFGQKIAKSTTKNYVSDVNKFMRWLDENGSKNA